VPVRPPSLAALRGLASRYGFELSDDELLFYREQMGGVLESYARLDALPELRPPVSYPRRPGHRPRPEENPLGAWYWRCEIAGAADGPLAGRTVAIKDNVAVAGVPMMNGCSVLEGFVPDVDATIVTRILEAGGEIVGKAVCEHLCFSDASHMSDTGPVRNPHDRERTAGGSSSGSAALVVNGDAEMAIGGDQGGSIRMPAAMSGAYGLKPTHGLVPYTGVFPIERTLDHVGPITRSVSDAALLLEAIAGPDGLDPRQADVRVGDYRAGLEEGIEGMRVGVLSEGFGWPDSEPDVDAAVREAAGRLTGLGGVVEEVSVPMHLEAVHIWNGIAIDGALAHMIRGNAGGANAKGYYDTHLIDAFSRGRARDPDGLSETVKLVTLLGEYAQTRYGGRYYAKAQNLARSLTAAYDEALAGHDLLVMPTTRMKAPKLPPPDADAGEKIARALEIHDQTCAFDVSGHPAISIPVALSEGLPVGLMAVGRQFDEATVLRFAHACESSIAIPVGVGGRTGTETAPAPAADPGRFD
jgi:amidase